jgi:hypothetical protein
MTCASLRIAVIGGGIGGLTAAVALLQAGFEVEVYEQAPELTEVGGGINMAPNATRVLRQLGLAEGLDREGVRPLGTHQRRWRDGRTLQRAPLNPLCEELYGAPHMTIHRADLLSVIAAAFPAERVHLGQRLVGLVEKGEGTEAWFDNGARITADVRSAPTASIRLCALRSSARRRRILPVALPIAGWCRPSASLISGSNSATNPGPAPAGILCIISSRAGGRLIVSLLQESLRSGLARLRVGEGH